MVVIVKHFGNKLQKTQIFPKANQRITFPNICLNPFLLIGRNRFKIFPKSSYENELKCYLLYDSHLKYYTQNNTIIALFKNAVPGFKFVNNIYKKYETLDIVTCETPDS